MAVTSAAKIRLMSDLKRMSEEPPDGCSASPVTDENIFVWNATIVGPEATPWEGGLFALTMVFPETYPDSPPKVRFTSEIFHPNVYGDGSICLDILQTQWSPINTVETVLVSIRSLLTDPNAASPANPIAAAMFKNDVKEYNKRVRAIVERSLDI